ncbi:transmembrane protein 80-like [Nematolebias whitei]|uniref:transmembrane protein 80-like n=1 Tax=Nematolebias whitei TaxID=451745 RepID=UPI00189B0321|nr:transmembrane protein 80-like [Nematolebias whitei]
MAIPGRGSRSAGLMSSVALQLLLNVTSFYFVFYFLFTLGLIVRKSLTLSYPADALTCDVALLFLLAALHLLHFFCGVKGNLTESESYILGNLVVTAPTILVSVYFLVWQTYVMRMDVIISSILVAVYSLDGVMALVTLARFARLVPLPLVFIAASSRSPAAVGGLFVRSVGRVCCETRGHQETPGGHLSEQQAGGMAG